MTEKEAEWLRDRFQEIQDRHQALRNDMIQEFEALKAKFASLEGGITKLVALHKSTLEQLADLAAKQVAASEYTALAERADAEMAAIQAVLALAAK